jgi:hypothetical protein
MFLLLQQCTKLIKGSELPFFQSWPSRTVWDCLRGGFVSNLWLLTRISDPRFSHPFTNQRQAPSSPRVAFHRLCGMARALTRLLRPDDPPPLSAPHEPAAPSSPRWPAHRGTSPLSFFSSSAPPWTEARSLRRRQILRMR